MDTSKLSKQVRAKVENKMAEVADLVDRDRRREPKLTEAERAEVASLEALIAELTPAIPQLTAKLEAAEARRKEIARMGIIWVRKGEDPARLADELNRLPTQTRLTADALRAALSEKEISKRRIEKIKEEAREREVNNDE